MTLPPRLAKEVAELAPTFHVVVTEEPDFINLVLEAFPLGTGYAVAASDLLIRVPRSYPDAGPDMFWVHETVLLENGAVPQSAESIETYMGKPWRRFSWHRQGNWNPTLDNVHSYIEFIKRRLRESK